MTESCYSAVIFWHQILLCREHNWMGVPRTYNNLFCFKSRHCVGFKLKVTYKCPVPYSKIRCAFHTKPFYLRQNPSLRPASRQTGLVHGNTKPTPTGLICREGHLTWTICHHCTSYSRVICYLWKGNKNKMDQYGKFEYQLNI